MRSWRAPRLAVLDGADELADDLVIRSPDEIDLAYAAAVLRAVRIFEPIGRGEGATLRSPAGAILSVDVRLEGTFEARFVEAHEIGHVVLHPDVGLSAYCRGASGSFFQGEIDASDFGSRFLTPAALVAAWLESLPGALASRISLDLVRAFAAAFRVPLSLALHRLVDALDEPIAVACTRGGKVAWWVAADAFPFKLTKGFHVGPRALAHAPDALARHEAHGEPEVVAAEAWSKHRKARGARVVEHSMRAPRDDQGALTLLRVHG